MRTIVESITILIIPHDGSSPISYDLDDQPVQ